MFPPHEILGIDPEAPEADIKKAYRKLVLQHHPDKNPNNQEAAAEKFKDVQKAYEILTDPEKAAEHRKEQEKEQRDQARQERERAKEERRREREERQRAREEREQAKQEAAVPPPKPTPAPAPPEPEKHAKKAQRAADNAEERAEPCRPENERGRRREHAGHPQAEHKPKEHAPRNPSPPPARAHSPQAQRRAKSPPPARRARSPPPPPRPRPHSPPPGKRNPSPDRPRNPAPPRRERSPSPDPPPRPRCPSPQPPSRSHHRPHHRPSHLPSLSSFFSSATHTPNATTAQIQHALTLTTPLSTHLHSLALFLTRTVKLPPSHPRLTLVQNARNDISALSDRLRSLERRVAEVTRRRLPELIEQLELGDVVQQVRRIEGLLVRGGARVGAVMAAEVLVLPSPPPPTAKEGAQGDGEGEGEQQQQRAWDAERDWRAERRARVWEAVEQLRAGVDGVLPPRRVVREEPRGGEAGAQGGRREGET